MLASRQATQQEADLHPGLYLCLDEQNGSVVYVEFHYMDTDGKEYYRFTDKWPSPPISSCQPEVQFSNSSVRQFAESLLVYKEGIAAVYAGREQEDWKEGFYSAYDAFVEMTRKELQRIDPTAMASEENFWPCKLLVDL